MLVHGVSCKGTGLGISAALNRAEKEALVEARRAHAALVYDGVDCVGWCQYGPPADLPRIKNAKACHATATGLPDWRITCFFVDKDYRGQGVAAAALNGAVAQMSQLGGGLVEGYPEDAAGRKVVGAFLFNGAMAMFEHAGFARTRQIGKHKWVVTKNVGL
jgi:GNAT superfamily N-acetyltransferase